MGFILKNKLATQNESVPVPTANTLFISDFRREIIYADNLFLFAVNMQIR